jgi:serine/threonine-protein kinase
VRTVLGRGAREPRRLGQALNARYLVDGAMLPGAAQVRIDVQLMEAATGRVRWAAAYQRPTEDLFGLIALVSDSVAAAIVGELAPSEHAALAARPTRSTAAYDAFVRAEALSRRDGFVNLRHAVTSYEDAIAQDSAFAAAWAGLAWVWMYHDQFFPARAVYPRARQAADHALALDAGLASALIARSAIATWFEYDYPRGERLSRSVLDREPRNARAHLTLAFALLGSGRVPEAAGEAQRALGLDSLDVPLAGDVAIILVAAGRPVEAETALRVAREVSGDSLMFGWLGAEILLSEGRCGPSALDVGGVLGTACRSGRDAAHHQADSIAVASTRGDGSYIPAYALASYYAAAGDREATLHWLERALEARSFLGLVATHPLFAFVRDDPRFQALLRAANIPIPPGP